MDSIFVEIPCVQLYTICEQVPCKSKFLSMLGFTDTVYNTRVRNYTIFVNKNMLSMFYIKTVNNIQYIYFKLANINETFITKLDEWNKINFDSNTIIEKYVKNKPVVEV